MALGHQGSTSTTPASPTAASSIAKSAALSSLTFQSSAAAQTANRNDNNSSPGPGIQPPLILAFVALGVLTVAAILLFWSRRIRALTWAGTTAPAYDDRWGEEDGMLPFYRPRRLIVPVEIPKLWDMQAESVETNDTDVEKAWWEHVKPLAARSLPAGSTYLPATKHTSPTSTVHSHMLHPLMPHTTATERPPSPSPLPSDDESRPLQLTLAILMPRAPRVGGGLGGTRSKAGDSAPESGPDEFCIGQTTVSWRPPPQMDVIFGGRNNETKVINSELVDAPRPVPISARNRNRLPLTPYGGLVFDSPAPT